MQPYSVSQQATLEIALKLRILSEESIICCGQPQLFSVKVNDLDGLLRPWFDLFDAIIIVIVEIGILFIDFILFVIGVDEVDPLAVRSFDRLERYGLGRVFFFSFALYGYALLLDGFCRLGKISVGQRQEGTRGL